MSSHTTALYYKCRNCGKECAPRGIKNHEISCMEVYVPREDEPAIKRSGDPTPPESPPSARFEFPSMLYKMLEECTFHEDHYKIISWQPHGLAFKVHNRDGIEKILPNWFREKYESFRCLLEQWGFLKLSRGKDRGCWYHKNFFHSSLSSHPKKKYENTSKAEFIEGMPEYLSPREEPDLEAESTRDNRIPENKRKKHDDMGSTKEKRIKTEDYSKSRKIEDTSKKRKPNDPSTHKQCRYCKKMFSSQGFKTHEEKCARINELVNVSSDVDAELSDRTGDEPDEDSEASGMVKCKYCKEKFSKYGVKKHEIYCYKTRYQGGGEAKDDEQTRKLQCQYCKLYFSKYGIKNHQTRYCTKAPDSNAYVADDVSDDVSDEVADDVSDEVADDVAESSDEYDEDSDVRDSSVNRKTTPTKTGKCKYCNETFSKHGLFRHEMWCDARFPSDGGENKRQDQSNGEETNDYQKGKEQCRYCKLYFSKYGIKNHENKYCTKAPDYKPMKKEGDYFIPCKFCGEFFSKFGVAKHELYCRVAERVPKNIEGSPKKDVSASEKPLDASSVSSTESGCRVCNFDDDHANLLLCEGCDTEIHTYCLNPPLEKIPEGEWFCDVCKMKMEKAEISMENLIREIPSEMRERFGEICFAKTSENAHWWPALIFDPRSFLHNPQVVDLARRNIGKRYLVFFFENQDAFAAIPVKWIISWEEGVNKGFDMGKSVRNASVSRKAQFFRALNLAMEGLQDEPEYVESSDEDDSTMENSNPRLKYPTKWSAPTVYDFDPDFDLGPLKEEVLRETEAASPSQYPINRTHYLLPSGNYQVKLHIGRPRETQHFSTFDCLHKACFAYDRLEKKLELALIDAMRKHGIYLPPELNGEPAPSVFDLDPRFDWKKLRKEALKETEGSTLNLRKKLEYPEMKKLIITTQEGKFVGHSYIGNRVLYLCVYTNRRRVLRVMDVFQKKMDLAFLEAQKNKKNDGVENKASDGASTTVTTNPADTTKSIEPESFGTFTDKRPSRARYRSVARSKSNVQENTEIFHSLSSKPSTDYTDQQTEKSDQAIETPAQEDANTEWQDKDGANMDCDADGTEEKQDLPEWKSAHLKDHERDELLMNVAMCRYYLLPLSEL